MPDRRNWYKTAVFYQIWVRSFADGNGDGIGDLYGVYDKLEYVRSLGTDAIWFNPLYPSPNADYGYDISDYCDIHPDYGDLKQFKKVLEKAHALGMKVIMDLVVNHTSDEHPWFKESRKGRDNPYSDYYIWRDVPNNWSSLLEGDAWEYDSLRGQYYLHLFAKKQPDLNMDNPKVREEVKKILRFWLDMGVDGFREDVINFISKREGLPNGISFLPILGDMIHYKDGPHIHEYMKEFREVCDEYGAVQIGEGPMTTVGNALTYLSGEKKSLDMMFSFDHMTADCLYTEYIHRPFKLVKLKKALSKWQNRLGGKAWNTLYLENHDHPRVLSRYGSERFHRESGCALAAAYLFLRGTPFIYQGQEIGMTNIRLRSIDEYKDVSSKNNYHKYHLKDTVERRLRRIHVSSRDSARTPMQWDGSRYAGFSETKPWFYVNQNYRRINVEKQEAENDSILQFYRKCIRLRKSSRTILFGDYREYLPGDPNVYVYERTLNNIHYLIISSFAKFPVYMPLPKNLRGRNVQRMLTNYPALREEGEKLHLPGNVLYLEPYEAAVFRFRTASRGKEGEPGRREDA